MLAATRDAGREPSERDAAAAAAWAALAAENDRLRRENAQLRRARPKVPRALMQLAPYNTPGPRSAATPTTSALVAPRRRKLLAAHPSVVSSDDEVGGAADATTVGDAEATLFRQMHKDLPSMQPYCYRDQRQRSK